VVADIGVTQTVHFLTVIEKLGIADAIKAKSDVAQAVWWE
jgi:hypothetical protein